MSHLLKEKAKIGIKQKERVTYEPFNFEKRSKDAEGNTVTHTKPEETKTNAAKTDDKNKKIKPKVVEKFDEPMDNK